MRYSQSGILKDTRPWGKMFVAGAAAVTLAVGLFASVNAAEYGGCDFDESVANTWSLNANCTAEGPINVPAGVTVNGKGNTIFANYTFGSNGAGTNTVIGVVGADGVTINDLTVDGTDGVALHGINVYESTALVLNNVTTKNNDKAGLTVNSSTVTVNNLTTQGNFVGVNVDQRTPESASLTVNGLSSHTEAGQIYVDDTTKDVTVVDTNNQYAITHPGLQPNDALYTLKAMVASKEDCKNNGFKNVYTADNKAFKSQGACVSYVVANPNASFKREQ